MGRESGALTEAIEPQGRLARVSGPSMFPYLRDDDLLWLEPLAPGDPLAPGQLVYARRNETGEVVVHRVLRGGQIKGDRTRQADDELPEGVTVLGTVAGRITRESSELRWVRYGGGFIRSAHQLQAGLSHFNRWRFPGINRVAAGSLSALGRAFRWIEDRFLQTSFKE